MEDAAGPQTPGAVEGAAEPVEEVQSSLEGAAASVEGAAEPVEELQSSLEGAEASMEGAAAGVEGAADIVLAETPQRPQQELQPSPETAGAVVDDAAASLEVAGAIVLAETPQRPQQALQPLEESDTKRPKVQHKLQYFFSPQPTPQQSQIVKVQAISSRHRRVEGPSQALQTVLEQAAEERQKLAEVVADVLQKREAHLQFVGADGKLAGVDGRSSTGAPVGAYWGPTGAPVGPHWGPSGAPVGPRGPQ